MFAKITISAIVVMFLAALQSTFAQAPSPPCKYCVDGVCIPKRTSYGWYQTQWRRWPTARKDTQPRPEVDADDLPKTDRPTPYREGDVVPSRRRHVGESPADADARPRDDATPSPDGRPSITPPAPRRDAPPRLPRTDVPRPSTEDKPTPGEIPGSPLPGTDLEGEGAAPPETDGGADLEDLNPAPGPGIDDGAQLNAPLQNRRAAERRGVGWRRATPRTAREPSDSRPERDLDGAFVPRHRPAPLYRERSSLGRLKLASGQKPRWKPDPAPAVHQPPTRPQPSRRLPTATLNPLRGTSSFTSTAATGERNRRYREKPAAGAANPLR